jgi:transcriptional regulator with PAS, ATPase and Fis domain
LRERKEDIPQLWDFFADKLAQRYGKSAPRLTQTVQRVLVEWDWPGNLCELENCIARVMILGNEEGIGEQLRRQAAFVNAADGRHENAKRSKSLAHHSPGETGILPAFEAAPRSQRKTPDDLKRSYRALLYRLRTNGGLQRPRRRRRFPRPE